MKTALITTTINVPTVLALYRKLGPDVAFFVAVDKKTPDAAMDFLHELPDTQICQGDKYKCSELIGWNCIQRRNIALLEAVKWGAEIIVTIDDDNVSLERTYFHWSLALLGLASATTIKTSSLSGWFDPGCLLVPQTKHRGFPISIKSEPIFESVVDAKIGVAAGLCLGDPDIDAVTRIALNPTIHSVSELGRAGVVVDPNTKTVFNSQNTAFIRELAPAMFMMPGVGRYDDIYASLICQRVMRERDLHVHFGQPFIWQQRNKHNLISDLRAEIDGMEHAQELGDWLTQHKFETKDTSVSAQVREIYLCLKQSWRAIPEQSALAAFAFLDDIEPLL